MQDVFKAAPLLADAILHRNLEILEEQFVGVDRLAAHLLDLVHGDPRAVEVGVKEAEAARGRLHVFQRRGARQQQNFFGDLCR